MALSIILLCPNTAANSEIMELMVGFEIRGGVSDMNGTERRFSPTEKRALEFAAAKHKGMTRMGGQEYITHPIAVAEYLYDHGYRGKYVFTALCHDLLEDTDATEQDIFNLGGRFTRDAVKLLTKNKGTGTNLADYLAMIKSNEVAYVVKVADRISNLRDALEADRKFREKYLLETKQYYLDFAEASSFAEDLYSAYEALREFHEYEEDKRIVVIVEDVYNMGSDPDLNILDAFYLGKGSSESFPIACIIDREEMKFAEIQLHNRRPNCCRFLYMLLQPPDNRSVTPGQGVQGSLLNVLPLRQNQSGL